MKKAARAERECRGARGRATSCLRSKRQISPTAVTVKTTFEILVSPSVGVGRVVTSAVANVGFAEN